jgi:exodeoxyribonuclease V alpha subunit
MAQKLISTYGADVAEIVKNNPYRLVDEIDGIGFQSADELAIKLGIKKDSQERFYAAIQYVLKKASLEGHLYLPKEVLIEELQKILDTEIAWTDDLPVIEENDRVYSRYFPRLECDVAEHVKGFSKGSFSPLKTGLIPKFEEDLNLHLSDAQRAALEKSLESKLCIITGGPGTGKSTITKILVKCALAQGKRVALAAPTGRAAQRLEEICGIEASTLHRLLKYDPTGKSFLFNQDNKLEIDLLQSILPKIIDILKSHSFMADALEQDLRSFANVAKINTKDLFYMIRIIITGSKNAPGLFECLHLLGQDEVLIRFSKYQKSLS